VPAMAYAEEEGIDFGRRASQPHHSQRALSCVRRKRLSERFLDATGRREDPSIEPLQTTFDVIVGGLIAAIGGFLAVLFVRLGSTTPTCA